MSIENATAGETVGIEPVQTDPRRHDLDALRAIAMLLGIVLHAALAYEPRMVGIWPIRDIEQNAVFSWLNAAIHGFRMPLFFLISGFFTAMLWRKRGLKSLLGQRFRRILLPLMIGMFTIVPAVWVVSIAGAMMTQSNQASNGAATDQAAKDLWSASRRGDLETLSELVGPNTDLDALEPVGGVTPLTAATLDNQTAVIQWLVDRGANIDARNRDGNSALHIACFLGKAAAAERLLSAGASLSIRNASGELPGDLLKIDWAVTAFIAGMAQLPVERQEVESGRLAIAELVAKERKERLEAQDQAGDMSAVAGAPQPSAGPDGNSNVGVLAGLYWGLTMFPVFHHLWFLWFLCWYVAAFAILAWIGQRLNWRGLPRWLVVTPAHWLYLLPLTLIPQSFMGLMFPSFGPDTSSGLLPLPMVLCFYGIFFFFGVLYYDSDDQKGELGKLWKFTLPLGLLVVFPLGYEFTTHEFGFGEQLLFEPWHRSASVVLQVVYAWLLTFGCMGAFRSIFSGASPGLRYLSDSAYWLYLMHLPLVMLLQIFIATWQIPATVKLLAVCAVSTALLLLSYQWLVRYTPIGTLLNGARVRPQSVAVVATNENVTTPGTGG